MVQAKVNRDLVSLEAEINSTNVNEGYITHSKSTINSTLQETEVNNVLPLQGPTNNANAEALAGEAIAFSPLSPPTNTSNSQNLH